MPSAYLAARDQLEYITPIFVYKYTPSAGSGEESKKRHRYSLESQVLETMVKIRKLDRAKANKGKRPLLKIELEWPY